LLCKIFGNNQVFYFFYAYIANNASFVAVFVGNPETNHVSIMKSALIT
jgi:hypothetical protein